MKLKLIIVSLFMITYGIFVYTNTQTKNERIELVLNEEIKDLGTHYNLTMTYFLQDVKSIRKNISNNKKVIDLFSQTQDATKEQKNILRDKMYKVLKPMYKRITARGILQLHFVFPDNKSFLRMHKPSKFGDDLTDIRYSFKHANLTKETVIGFEQGRTTHAFRYVVPFYDKQGNHLGAMEISLASYALQEKLLTVNKIRSHFLVNKNIFSAKAWETKNLIQKYIPSIEHKDYMFALTQHSSSSRLKDTEKKVISKVRDEIDKGILLKKPFAVHSKFENNMQVVTFLPIKDTQEKEVVAYIVSYTNSNNIKNICDDYNSSNIIVFFGLLFLFYFIYKNLKHKDELSIEVEKKTEELNKLTIELKEQVDIEVAKNKEIQQLSCEVKESEEELQVLNDNLESRIIIEVDKNKHIQEQLFKSEKMASMGDMVGNIAHQWRQPLSVISTAATGIIMQKEYDILDETKLIDTCNIINDNAQYLSKTIDDFTNFIKGDRTKKIFNLKENIDSFLHLVEGSVKNHNLNIILDLKEDIKIDGYPNELTQCFINIFNNAKDVIKKQNYRYLFISTSIQNDKAIIKIKDNGGGIPRDVLPKIFEPYFTTKHKSQGTGLGLHMTYNLIVDGMGGTVEASNVSYDYDGKDYVGAEFEIILPI